MIRPPEETVHPWLAHLSGLTAILRARSKRLGDSFPGIGFFISLDSSPGRSTWPIHRNTPVDGWFMDGSDRNRRMVYRDVVGQDGLNLSPNLTARNARTRASLDDLILRTQPILQAAASLLDPYHPREKANVERFLRAAHSVLSSFKLWPLNMPDYWQPIPVRHQAALSELVQLDIFPGKIDMYSDCKWPK